jgi:hypothetical protein
MQCACTRLDGCDENLWATCLQFGASDLGTACRWKSARGKDQVRGSLRSNEYNMQVVLRAERQLSRFFPDLSLLVIKYIKSCTVSLCRDSRCLSVHLLY